MEQVKFEHLKGKTLTKIEIFDDKIFFHTKNQIYKMFHYKQCCESVYIEDICGELDWLIGTPILLAEERISEDGPLYEYHESFCWTFYEIATLNGAVTIRWYGSSNGYYSESVDFELVIEGAHE